MGSLPSSATAPDSQRRNVANKPVEVALNEIVTRARVFTDAGGAAIALRDGDEIVTRASSGSIAPDVGTRMSIERSLTGQALLKGVPVHVVDSDKDPRVDAETCRAMNTRSFIVTPIAGSTTMLGVLAVFAPTPNAFTRTDLAVLRTMADQISAAVGGGAFLQQTWPARVEPPEAEESPAAWEQPDAPPDQTQQTSSNRPTSVAPVPDEALADVFTPPESIVAPAPVPPAAVPAQIEIAPKVEPESRTDKVVPIAQPAEPANISAPPARSASALSAPLVPQPSTDSRATKYAQTSGQVQADRAPVKVQTRQSVPARPVTAEPDVVSLADAIDEHKKLPRPAAPQRTKAVPVRATASDAPAITAPREQIAWKGLTVDAAADRRPIGRIVAGLAAIVVIGAAITGWMALHKQFNTKPPAAPAPLPAQDSAAIAPAAAPATTPSVVSPRSSAPTSPPTAPEAKSKQQTAEAKAKPAQPAIVLASGTSSVRPAVVEDQAPPQLAFAGEKPRLMDTSAVPVVAAAPPRATSTLIPAELVRKVAPAFPEMARQLHQKGSVVLQARVMKDGTVGKIDVLSGAPLFRPAAVNAVKQWRYRPAQLGGTPVESSVDVVVNFETPTGQR